MEDPHARDVRILRVIENPGTCDAVPCVSSVAALHQRWSRGRQWEHRAAGNGGTDEGGSVKPCQFDPAAG